MWHHGVWLSNFNYNFELDSCVDITAEIDFAVKKKEVNSQVSSSIAAACDLFDDKFWGRRVPLLQTAGTNTDNNKWHMNYLLCTVHDNQSWEPF